MSMSVAPTAPMAPMVPEMTSIFGVATSFSSQKQYKPHPDPKDGNEKKRAYVEDIDDDDDGMQHRPSTKKVSSSTAAKPNIKKPSTQQPKRPMQVTPPTSPATSFTGSTTSPPPSTAPSSPSSDTDALAATNAALLAKVNSQTATIAALNRKVDGIHSLCKRAQAALAENKAFRAEVRAAAVDVLTIQMGFWDRVGKGTSEDAIEMGFSKGLEKAFRMDEPGQKEWKEIVTEAKRNVKESRMGDGEGGKEDDGDSEESEGEE